MTFRWRAAVVRFSASRHWLSRACKHRCAPQRAVGGYPSKDELLQAVEQGFEKARQLAQVATAEQLAAPSTSANPIMKAALPTLKEGAAFLLTGHLGVHLGQLSTWRRMIGLPHMF